MYNTDVEWCEINPYGERMSDDDSEFRRGQNAAFDAMWEALGQAEHELRDDAGTIDPYARAVLAVVRGQLDAVVSAIDGEWACEERVQRARAAGL